MKYIVNICYLAGLVLYSPKILYRMLRHKRYQQGWGQRRGYIDRKNPDKKCIWIHAVSVGEVNATRTLVKTLNEVFSDYEILITSTTDTGYARARVLYDGEHTVSYFPADMSFTMSRAFDRIDPAVCLLMELEVWPNFASIAKKRNIPVLVVNGRLSDRSFPRYRLIRPVTKWMFSKVTLFLVQSHEYAKRFEALGCDRQKIRVTNSMKYDTAVIGEQVEGAEEVAEKMRLDNSLLWTGGGTGPGEEKIILETFRRLIKEEQLKHLKLALVPRKPERFSEAGELIARYGFEYAKFSEYKDSGKKLQEPVAVILVDTMGDLRKFYARSDVVFVGRTLVPMGGSDMMEPAALGKCTIFGPHTFNFTQTVDALLKNVGAIKVSDAQELYEVTRKCLLENGFAKAIASNGQSVIRENQGATERTVKIVQEVLQAHQPADSRCAE